MDGYMTHLAYHTFEEVGEKNDYIDFMVRQLGTPDGLIIGMGIPSIAAIILAKVLNDRFSWTKHWGTAALAIMAGISLFGAYNNMSLYLQNI